MTTWAVSLVETMTGRVGALLPATDGGSWSDTINGAPAISVTVPTAWLLRQPRWQWAPWSGSLLVTADGEPVALGPILEPANGDRDMVTLTAGGLWSILERRIVTDQNRTDGAALAASSLRITAGSLVTIARRIVERVQDRPAGGLPVAYGSPLETGSTRTREYAGHNLANNSAAKRLAELTEVVNGPDIAFRPMWAERGQRVHWMMVHGTEAMPQIAQRDHFTIDLDAPRSVASVAKISAAAEQWGRVYATGAGEGAGMLVRVETATPDQRVPLLETTISDSQTENGDLLSSRARAMLGTTETVQIQATVSDPSMPIHRWWAGDAMSVRVGPGWAQLAAGVHRMRILSRSGTIGSEHVTVELQREADL